MLFIKVLIICIIIYVSTQILAVVEQSVRTLIGYDGILSAIDRWTDIECTSAFGKTLELSVLIYFVSAFYLGEKLGVFKDSTC